MSRVFRHGELQRAIIGIIAERGSANGYTIMHALADRLEGRWRPSPGAVYPALLGLEDAGLVSTEEVGGTKVYGLSPSGRRQADQATEVLDAVVDRARQRPATLTLGALLDRFTVHVPNRQHPLTPDQAAAVESRLDELVADLQAITTTRST